MSMLVALAITLLPGIAGVWFAIKGRTAVRRTAGMLVEFIALWYLGALMDFFPFLGDDFGVRAAGFTGLLVCLNVALCAGWIMEELRRSGRAPEKEEEP